MKVKQFDEKTWKILKRIREASLSRNSSEIIWKRQKDINEDFVYEKDEEFALAKIEARGAIKQYTKPLRLVQTGLEGYGDVFQNIWDPPKGKVLCLYLLNPKFNKVYEKGKKEYGEESNPKPTKSSVSPKQIKIKAVRLDEKNYFLEINNGEKIISFKLRKKISTGNDDEEFNDSEREELKIEVNKTKMFKVLCELWRFRWEKIGGKIRKVNEKTSDTVTLKNLAVCSQCKNVAATKKQIERLNKKFEKEEILIYIESKNEKAIRLIIDKS